MCFVDKGFCGVSRTSVANEFGIVYNLALSDTWIMENYKLLHVLSMRHQMYVQSYVQAVNEVIL